MDETMSETVRTPPFAPFEWLLSGRYLRARRKEGFISVIAGFSFLGIMLGVATLIIVMAVMNGFRKDLFSKILGLNGHVIVHKIGEPFEDYAEMVKRISAVPGVKHALPLMKAQGRGRVVNIASAHVATFGETDADMAAEAELAGIAASHLVVRRAISNLRAGLHALASGKPVSLAAFASAAIERLRSGLIGWPVGSAMQVAFRVFTWVSCPRALKGALRMRSETPLLAMEATS